MISLNLLLCDCAQCYIMLIEFVVWINYSKCVLKKYIEYNEQFRKMLICSIQDLCQIAIFALLRPWKRLNFPVCPGLNRVFESSWLSHANVLFIRNNNLFSFGGWLPLVGSEKLELLLYLLKNIFSCRSADFSLPNAYRERKHEQCLN